MPVERCVESPLQLYAGDIDPRRKFPAVIALVSRCPRFFRGMLRLIERHVESHANDVARILVLVRRGAAATKCGSRDGQSGIV